MDETAGNKYHLLCDKCLGLFWTIEAFPEPQVCPRCAPAGRGRQTSKEQTGEPDEKMNKKQAFCYGMFEGFLRAHAIACAVVSGVLAGRELWGSAVVCGLLTLILFGFVIRAEVEGRRRVGR